MEVHELDLFGNVIVFRSDLGVVLEDVMHTIGIWRGADQVVPEMYSLYLLLGGSRDGEILKVERNECKVLRYGL